MTREYGFLLSKFADPGTYLQYVQLPYSIIVSGFRSIIFTCQHLQRRILEAVLLFTTYVLKQGPQFTLHHY